MSAVDRAVTKISARTGTFCAIAGVYAALRRTASHMAPRERPPRPPAGARDAASSAQRSLVFETDQRGRDETALLHALNRAFVLLRNGAQESALRESFVLAMTGLGAEKGVLIQVRQ